MREALQLHHPETLRSFTQPTLSDIPEDEDGPGGNSIAVLAVALLFLADNPSYSLVLAGHTDASELTPTSRDLAEKRVRGVRHLLMGQRSEWVELCGQRTSDAQRLLRHVAQVTAWDCDPGAADDIPGPMTARALRAFQAAYNAKPGRPSRIPVDGSLGGTTWGAVFDVLQDELASLVDVAPEALAAQRSSLRILDGLAFGPTVRIVGARRVDFLFLADKAAPLRTPEGAPNPSLYSLDWLAIDPIWWAPSIPVAVSTGSFSIADNDGSECPLPAHPLDGEYRDTVDVGSPPLAGDDPWAFLDAMALTAPCSGGSFGESVRGPGDQASGRGGSR